VGPLRTGRTAPSTDELEQIRYALDQAAIVAITDVTGRIQYVNDKFCEISKYGRQELLGQDHRILNSGYHSKAFMRDLWRTIANGRVWRQEIRNRAKDGSFYWVDTTIVPFLGEGGKPAQYMAIRYDITERKAQEQRLLVQKALSSLGEMAAVVAHEVRNPLAGIRGGVQVLGSMLPGNIEGQELVSDIVTRIDSLNSILSDMLTFARVSELHPVTVDVRTFLADLTAALKLDPAMRGVELTVTGDLELKLEADIDQLRLVFMNIALNAAQAMNNSGRVEIHAGQVEDGGIAISVRDFGPGIPPTLHERVFEPFFTTKHHGTGLGLPTARRIVEAHGGRLGLHDAPGGGAIVTVRLPRHVRG
jgi:PAS domain S-box-containing protein